MQNTNETEKALPGISAAAKHLKKVRRYSPETNVAIQESHNPYHFAKSFKAKHFPVEV